MFFYNSSIITFRLFISILFLLEVVCVFGYSSSIYFFFIFFVIFYTFFSKLTDIIKVTELTLDTRSLISQLNAILNLMRYEKSIFLSFLFYDTLLKKYLSYYKLVLNNRLLNIFNYTKFDFILKFYFLNSYVTL